MEIDEKPLIEQSVRVGTERDGSRRPVKYTLKSTLHVQRILNNTRKIRSKDGFSSIYILPDRSSDEPRAYRKPCNCVWSLLYEYLFNNPSYSMEGSTFSILFSLLFYKVWKVFDKKTGTDDDRQSVLVLVTHVLEVAALYKLKPQK